MDNLTELVERYFGVWNETDANRRHALIAQTWADDARYIDPLMQGEGHAGIDAMVQGVQDQFAGHQFRLTSAIDSHHNYVRFAWELAQAGKPAIVGGTDIGTVSTDGRLLTIIGFIDHAPSATA